MPAIALVSREVFPFGGGGIGVHVTSLAAVLADRAEVTVFTSAHQQEAYEELRAAGDPRLPVGVRFEFVEEPNPLDYGTFYTYMQSWSSRVCDALRRLYGAAGGPDLVEFPDYLGEGLVTAQARDTLDPAFRNTRVCVRTHTSGEMCSVLDGQVDDSFNTRVVFDSERYALRRADTLVWPGGDVLGTYQRFYGADQLAPGARIPAAFLPDQLGEDAQPPAADGPVRLIYVGRLERRKGVQNLLRAAAAMPMDGWELTLVGADTNTAPLGTSMKLQLELIADSDPRIKFIDGVDRHELPALVASHHAAVLPSLWECWPNSAMEALALGRPVVATPTGGYVEMVKPGESGWLTADVSDLSLVQTLHDVVAGREQLDELIASGRPRKFLEELEDPERIRESYLELVGNGASAPKPGRREAVSKPLVSVVLSYFKLEQFVEDAISSVFEQTYRPLELIVVNDGAMREADLILAELAERYPMIVLTQPNSGLGAARNFGISQTRGEFIVPLDADNMLEPDFIARGVELLQARPDYAYVTSWSRYVGEDGKPAPEFGDGYQPIGNWTDMINRDNVAGDATSVMRRRIFDLGHWYSQDMTSYEDWLLYRELHAAGIEGAVIPERLFRYRVREGSMIREVGLQKQGRLADEMRAHIRERQVRWESKNG
jgi:glycosyltransferase involved in cell wall biosynthesis